LINWINENTVDSSACILVGQVTATSGLPRAGGTSTTTADVEETRLSTKDNTQYIFFIRMLIMY